MLKIFISEGVELKKTAKKQLKGNWAWAIGLAFISQFIIGFLVGFNKQVWTQGLQFSELDPGQKNWVCPLFNFNRNIYFCNHFVGRNLQRFSLQR